MCIKHPTPIVLLSFSPPAPASMQVFSLVLPDKLLTNIELSTYAQELQIPRVRGVFMRHTLPQYPYSIVCGIVNLNTSNQPGRHWVFCYRNKNDRIYFDSYS